MSNSQSSQETNEAREINVASDKFTDSKDVTFRFKKDSLGNKRPNVSLSIPVPSIEGIVRILETGGAGLDLLREALDNVVRSVAQEKVSNDENVKDQESFATYLKDLSWEAIANMPKEDRRSSSISEEDWKAFAAAYIDIMPALTNKTMDAVTNATLVYLKKFAQFKTDKATLRKLKGQLAIFAEQPVAEQFEEILSFLVKRVDTYLAADDVAALAANL